MYFGVPLLWETTISKIDQAEGDLHNESEIAGRHTGLM